MPATKRWSVEEVRAMQDADRAWPRHELVDGELLVTPAPRLEHQRAVMALGHLMRGYVATHGLGELLASPADLELVAGTVVQPDLFVVPGDHALRSWADVRALLLAVEVLSPGSGRADRVIKRRLYQRARVPEYWVVDTDARVVERWRPDDERAELLDATLVWHPEGADEPLTLDLASFFASVHREASP